MTEPKTFASLRRNLLGLSGLACLLIGIYFYIRPPQDASWEFLQGSCVKSGLVLLAAWLAFPQLERMPGWAFAGLIGFLLLVAVRPRIVLAALRYVGLLVPIFVVIWLLRAKPRTKRPS